MNVQRPYILSIAGCAAALLALAAAGAIELTARDRVLPAQPPKGA